MRRLKRSEPGEAALLIITGMHRSGTSSIAMLLEGLGVPLGDPAAFYGADQWNERGYYERRDVIDLNSRLITGFTRTQGRAAAIASQLRYLRVPRASTIASRARRLAPELARLARELGPIAVKDPRFCLTHEAWAPWTTSTVVVIRHPSAVVASIARRQRVPRRLAFAFWDDHARGVLRLDPAKSHVVDFDALADEAHREAELAALTAHLALGLSAEDVNTRFHERYAPSLRHFAPQQEPLPSVSAQLWAELEARRTAS